MELKELKEMLRIDGNDLDAPLTLYQKAAETYLSNAGVAKNYDNSLYKVVISVIVGIFIDNPNLISEKSVGSLEITLNALIAQLRMCG